MIQDNYSLSEAQIQDFEVFGFLVRRNVFTAEEVSRMNDEFDHRLASIIRETDPERKRIFNNWPNRNPETPFIASVLEDPRIYFPAEQLTGEDSVPVNSNANSYGTNSTWHADTNDHHLCVIKNVMYLQPTTADHGALRVIPGSHKNPLHEDLLRIGLEEGENNEPRFLEKSGMRGEEIPCYIFESNPGDIITFNELTWHAAFGGYRDRRTCTFNFSRNPKTPEEIASMQKELDRFPESNKVLGTVGMQYHPWWLENPDNDQRRARWINWLTEWGFIKAGNN
jgi:ectoine hydroxylase-related dioxygenase (phytanoyl-CoA dioxygenase family)